MNAYWCLFISVIASTEETGKCGIIVLILCQPDCDCKDTSEVYIFESKLGGSDTFKHQASMKKLMQVQCWLVTWQSGWDQRDFGSSHVWDQVTCDWASWDQVMLGMKSLGTWHLGSSHAEDQVALDPGFWDQVVPGIKSLLIKVLGIKSLEIKFCSGLKHFGSIKSCLGSVHWRSSHVWAQDTWDHQGT